MNDDFEVIYTEEDIKLVTKKFDEINSKYTLLLKEKKENEIFIGALKDKIKSFEDLKKEYETNQDIFSS